MSPAIASNGFAAGTTPGNDITQLDPEMVELALLLPLWQAFALETAAKERGISTGQMLRRMIAAVVGAQPPISHR